MRAEYREEPCKVALNRVKGMAFGWSLNPYMGCAHRCTYCYVRAYEKRADRPSDDRWSPLEYGCHVRDVYRLYRYRLQLMLDEDDPTYPNWDQDQTAIDDRYAEQDPAVVVTELRDAAESLSAGFDSVTGDAWHRTGTRGDGAHFTVETFARYFVHDPIHHLYDVTGIPAA